MPKYDFDIGILGGGAAGLTVAAGAGQFGAKVLLIEKEQVLGGDCLHYGCVPSKTLIRSAHVYHTIKRARQFGLPAVDVSPVDFRDIAQRIQHVIATIQKHDSAERFCGLGVRVEFGNAAFVDEHVVRVNGISYSANRWVISTGSSPDIPPVEGLSSTPFITNRELFSLDSLPGSMIILGAGPVAIEMAQAFSRLGTKVAVVQRSAQILSREDRDMADMVMNVLQSEGVTFHLDSVVSSTRDSGGQKEIIIKRMDGREMSLRADRILIAAGRKANTGGLGLEGLSMDFDDNGIAVDNRMRTSHAHIYAAGDITGKYQFTHAAGYEGGIVLSNAVLHLPRRTDYTWLPWCTYTDPELAGIGMNEKRAANAGIAYTVWTEEFRANDRSLAEGEETGKIKVLLDAKGRPLGVQIFGPRAGEILSEWVAVLNGGVKLSTLVTAVHPYPTLAEINRKVIGNYFSGRIFSEKVKKTLKFFFGLKGRACEHPR